MKHRTSGSAKFLHCSFHFAAKRRYENIMFTYMYDENEYERKNIFAQVGFMDDKRIVGIRWHRLCDISCGYRNNTTMFNDLYGEGFGDRHFPLFPFLGIDNSIYGSFEWLS